MKLKQIYKFLIIVIAPIMMLAASYSKPEYVLISQGSSQFNALVLSQLTQQKISQLKVRDAAIYNLKENKLRAIQINGSKVRLNVYFLDDEKKCIFRHQDILPDSSNTIRAPFSFQYVLIVGEGVGAIINEGDKILF